MKVICGFHWGQSSPRVTLGSIHLPSGQFSSEYGVELKRRGGQDPGLDRSLFNHRAVTETHRLHSRRVGTEVMLPAPVQAETRRQWLPKNWRSIFLNDQFGAFLCLQTRNICPMDSSTVRCCWKLTHHTQHNRILSQGSHVGPQFWARDVAFVSWDSCAKVTRWTQTFHRHDRIGRRWTHLDQFTSATGGFNLVQRCRKMTKMNRKSRPRSMMIWTIWGSLLGPSMTNTEFVEKPNTSNGSRLKQDDPFGIRGFHRVQSLSETRRKEKLTVAWSSKWTLQTLNRI